MKVSSNYKMHYKGEEASPTHTVWAALLAEKKAGSSCPGRTTGNIQGTEKGLITQILQTVKTALAGQTGPYFSELIPGSTGLLLSSLL